MNITCNTKTLSDVCTVVQRAVSQKSTLPSIEGILLEAKDGKLLLIGYDLEMGITSSIDCRTDENGTIILNAALFCGILKKLPSERVTITVDEHNMCRIISGETEFSLIGIPADDYPELPSVSGGYTLNIDQKALREMIRQTIFAVSVTDSKIVHKGIKFEITSGNLRLVAVDGYRLAIRNEPISYDGEEFSFVVPSKTLSEIIKLINEDGENIIVNVGKRVIVFEVGCYSVISRLLEGEFLKYASTIPSEFTTTARLNLRMFTDSIERTSLIITNKLKSPVRCIFGEGCVRISSVTTLGTANDRIDAAVDGKKLEIGFNNMFLLDALRACETDEIKVELNSPVSPIIIKPVEGDSFLFLILPVRLKNEG